MFSMTTTFYDNVVISALVSRSRSCFWLWIDGHAKAMRHTWLNVCSFSSEVLTSRMVNGVEVITRWLLFSIVCFP